MFAIVPTKNHTVEFSIFRYKVQKFCDITNHTIHFEKNRYGVIFKNLLRNAKNVNLRYIRKTNVPVFRDGP